MFYLNKNSPAVEQYTTDHCEHSIRTPKQQNKPTQNSVDQESMIASRTFTAILCALFLSRQLWLFIKEPLFPCQQYHHHLRH
mmetsp:Transcript_32723/g.43631  ORF Transcript_32723/g.43631 Transcript_32723/m.43631 type:complete len:82 (-) Transcript_32723:686-931(-)